MQSMKLLALSSLWALSFMINEVLLGSMPSAAIVFYRALISSGFLIVTYRAYLQSMRFSRSLLLEHVLLALFNYVFPAFLLIWSQNRLGVTVTALGAALTPLFTLIVTLLILPNERIRASTLVWMAVGCCGFLCAVLSLGPYEFSVSGLPLVAIIGASLSYALGAAFGQKFSRGHSECNAVGQMAAATIVVLPFALIDPRIVAPPTSLNNLLLILALGIVCTGLAYILFFKILETAGAVYISFVSILVPVIIMIFNFVFFDVNLSVSACFGIFLILISVLRLEKDRANHLRTGTAT